MKTGPLFYLGWYHLFYQWNPDAAIWGNITWGHGVSRDLIHWEYLPLAMVPDHWYNINGVWTGSATLLSDGKLVMLYTGSTNESVQVQNLAFPANPSDPLLLDWVKYENNPVLLPPSGIGSTDFRDPTTAWFAPDGTWRLTIDYSSLLDIYAEFEIKNETLEAMIEADVGYNCSTSEGAAGRSSLGPFGLLVLADQSLSEQTAVYFYIGKGSDGNLKTFFCQDELRSSKANDLVKRVYGSTVPVLSGEKFAVRILVDHSIVESFAQGGRTCITSRVYPTKAIYGGARIFLFNNATGADITATSVKIWQMNSSFIHPYSDQSWKDE
ncbi:beta-fructofuranosidase, soluble isoenzyme I-like [Tasmannia lanceolata]|uniref:beta-fructofuranosidase, soluble isoenzyme I-like n=1 Tax=Tasmannia lanceolata TaxID=3420 RepID=UPI0040641E49